MHYIPARQYILECLDLRRNKICKYYYYYCNFSYEKSYTYTLSYEFT
jgi:hypothetical protein